MNKRASLSLSINAIVILVLAISMLGLGLTFTKAMFAKFGGALKVPEPENPATADEPIALPSTTIEGKDNEPFGFAVSVYNKGALPDTVAVEILDCDGDIGDDEIKGGLALATPATIGAKSTVSAKFLVEPQDLGETSVCTITALFTTGGHTLTKQVAIMVVE